MLVLQLLHIVAQLLFTLQPGTAENTIEELPTTKDSVPSSPVKEAEGPRPSTAEETETLMDDMHYANVEVFLELSLRV